MALRRTFSVAGPPGGSGHCFCRLLHHETRHFYLPNIWRANLQRSLSFINQKFTILSVLFARQFKAIAGHRIKRTVQLHGLGQKLGYDTRGFITESCRKMVKNYKSAGMIGAAAMFNWEQEGIRDEEMKRVGEQFKHIKETADSGRVFEDPRHPDEWEKILDKDRVTIWRRPLYDSLYEYKLFGTFTDISARSFYCSQTDFEFRKTWDNLIVKLHVIDKDRSSGTEVIQWITHFPRPFYKREYIYTRKAKIDKRRNLMIVISRGTDHPLCPKDKTKYVRVEEFESTFVVRPHKTFDENGFDYILTYHDDPKCTLPSVAYNWVATTGVPDYADKLHDNAVKYQEYKKSQRLREEESGDGTEAI